MRSMLTREAGAAAGEVSTGAGGLAGMAVSQAARMQAREAAKAVSKRLITLFP